MRSYFLNLKVGKFQFPTKCSGQNSVLKDEGFNVSLPDAGEYSGVFNLAK